MEVIAFFAIVLIGIIIPLLFFTLFKYFFYNLYYKQDKISYLGLIKKSWLFSLLWLILIWISFFVLGDMNDDLFIRTLVSFGFTFIFILLNYLNLKKIEPVNSINKRTFINFYAVNYCISIIIIASFFYKFYPNEIIKLNSISDFNKKINHISTCNSQIKSINESILKSKNVLYAKYKFDEIIIIIKVENGYEKMLFSNISLNKITKQYLDTNYITLNNEELKDPTKKIELNAFTSRIGQSTVYAYTIENPTFLVDFKTSYHYSKHIELKCTDFMEHYCNVDFFYDSSSKYLVLVEEIYSDGP